MAIWIDWSRLNRHCLFFHKIHIKDYSLTTDLADDFSSAGFKAKVWLRNLSDSKSGKLSLEVLLKGKNRNEERFVKRLITPVKNLPATSAGCYTLSSVVENPKLWSAEKPNLYDVEIRLYDGKKVVEEFQSHIGIWKCEIDGNVFKFNGQSTGYWKERNKPSRARSSGFISRTW